MEIDTICRKVSCSRSLISAATAGWFIAGEFGYRDTLNYGAELPLPTLQKPRGVLKAPHDLLSEFNRCVGLYGYQVD